ncbi:hypothetical protein LNV09_14665 [Paucibacter sp. B2R-40]|uniref:hypothetical protein n=1 Tax=Paucibacter sp. B2R-40 TaxID=2893554 RepID=UPI0021E4A4B0|nr:hypothetical protein [Paucibacter sp. B2R-40]MCV2355394.1 hypothetical protein [Paucibacter sp. B2R-40]
MQTKRRGNRVLLIESTYVRKGVEGNSHGFTRQTQVCSLPWDSRVIPDNLEASLTPEQRQHLMDRVVVPAQRREAQRKAEEVAHKVDPVWRIKEAHKLVLEAASLGKTKAVPLAAINQLTEALHGLAGSTLAPAVPHEKVGDPLGAAMASIKIAVKAVDAGHYGTAPATGVRETKTYRLWQELFSAVGGDGQDSLMRALQRCGFVKTKA